VSDTDAAGSAAALLHAELTVVVNALWFEIDHSDGATVPNFFTDDAELTFFGHTVRGRAEIAEVYRARTARGPRVSRHLATNLHVVHSEPATVRAQSVVVLHAEDGRAPIRSTAPLLVADVHDLFVRPTAGSVAPYGWLLAARRLEHCFAAPAAVLAVPTGEERS
jgi:hypothetical protein